MTINKLSSVFLMGVALSACMTANDHRKAVEDTSGSQTLTLGKAQQSLRVGMAQADVAVSLGSPNIVSTDAQGHETWIYDKISSERVASDSSEGAGIGALGGGLIGSALLGGMGSANAQHSASAVQTSQKTLTVIVKFDAQKRVKDINYNSSKF